MEDCPVINKRDIYIYTYNIYIYDLPIKICKTVIFHIFPLSLTGASADWSFGDTWEVVMTRNPGVDHGVATVLFLSICVIFSGSIHIFAVE